MSPRSICRRSGRTLVTLLTASAIIVASGPPALAGNTVTPVTPGPEYGYDVNSFLTPTHFGNYIVGAGVGYDGEDPEDHCWNDFEDILYPDTAPEDYEPTPEAIELALGALPPECHLRAAVQIREPEILVDNCPTGTIFAVRGQVQWYPGSPLDPPGHYSFSGYTSSPTVDELIFNTCLQIFDPGDDIAHIEDLVPVPGFGKSPEVVGLTGLDTWLWYDFTDPLSHTMSAIATVDTIQGLPITVEATAWVDGVQWDMDGDGDWDTSIDIPDPSWHEAPSHETYVEYGGGNSEDDAAQIYVYETKGLYTVSIGVVWRGTYTVTVPGFGGLYEYTPVTRVETFAYQVCELQGVVTNPGEDPDLNTCPLP